MMERETRGEVTTEGEIERAELSTDTTPEVVLSSTSSDLSSRTDIGMEQEGVKSKGREETIEDEDGKMRGAKQSMDDGVTSQKENESMPAIDRLALEFVPQSSDEVRQQIEAGVDIWKEFETFTYENLMEFYACMAEDFDKDMVSADYVAPEWGAEYLSNTGMPKDSKVLDCAAGTGLVAEVLRRKFGFVGEIDAIDGCAEMLEKAKEKKIFNKLVCCKMGEGNRLPFDDNIYDGVVMVGGLAAGHIRLDVFTELIRIVKSGGFIVNVFEEQDRRLRDIYKSYDEYTEGLEKQGLWLKVKEEIKEKYFFELEGLINVWKVL